MTADNTPAPAADDMFGTVAVSHRISTNRVAVSTIPPFVHDTMTELVKNAEGVIGYVHSLTFETAKQASLFFGYARAWGKNAEHEYTLRKVASPKDEAGKVLDHILEFTTDKGPAKARKPRTDKNATDTAVTETPADGATAETTAKDDTAKTDDKTPTPAKSK